MTNCINFNELRELVNDYGGSEKKKKLFYKQLMSLGYELVESNEKMLLFEREIDRGDHCVLYLYLNGDVYFCYKNIKKDGYGPLNKEIPWVLQNDEIVAILEFRKLLKL